MKQFSTLLLLTLFSILGYSQNYYHAPEGKMELQVSTNKILIKFKPDVSFVKQQAILDAEAKVVKLDPSNVLPAPTVTLVDLQQVNSVNELEALLTRLEQNEVIEYANHFLAHKDGTLHGITDQVLVRLKQLGDVDLLQNIAAGYQVEVSKSNEFDPFLFHLTVSPEAEVNALEMANVLAESGLFDYAEPDFLRLMKRMNTNDPFVGNQWALNNTGANTSQYGGVAGADMSVFSAWATTTGSSSIKVAILDEGVDLTHNDLTPNLESGYDATGQGSGGGPSGNDAHGTACAGIVASVGNNGTGTAGVAYGVRIVPVRIAYSSGPNWITSNSWIGNSINWAWQTAGSDILSNSWGGGSSSSTINNAIDGAVNSGRGGLGSPVLFAAGNDNGANSYPATYSPTISVIAMSMCNQRKSPSSCDGETWWGSNYGNGADVAAPGVKIYATDISGSAGYSSGDYTATFNGTSSACPNAAGVMALVLSASPSLTEDQARQALESTCDKVGGYSYGNNGSQPNGTWSTELGYGRVNAAAAVASVSSSAANDAGIASVDAPSGSICGTSATPSVTLRNNGTNTLTSVAINYSLDGGGTSTYNWTGSLASLSTTSVSLPSISFSDGSHTLAVSTSSPNGQADENTANDGASGSFTSGSNAVTLTIVLDNYPGETSWDIRDGGGTIVASGSGYSGQGSTVTANLCLADGCFDFNIYDSYGDGICCGYGNGSYSLVEDASGTVLASGGAFTSSETTNFCVPQGGGGDPLSASITSSTNVSCNGGSNGSATAAGSGGSGSYSYSWSNGASGATASGLSAGSYTVTVNDGSGTATASVTISQPSAVSVSVSGVDATNGSNGSATASASGGTGGYSYAWSNGGSGASIAGLAPGSYSVTATDANGCTATGSVTIADDSGGGACTTTLIDYNDFESGWGIWNDGGSDARRSANDAAYSLGTFSIRLRDNTSTSVMTTDNLNLASFEEVTINFSYYPRSMDNSNEDFWLQASTNGGSSYQTLTTWARNIDFNNDTRYSESVVITGTFTSTTRFRFRCDASGNSDWVYIDEVEITGCSTGSSSVGPTNNTVQPEEEVSAEETPVLEILDHLKVYPNPADEYLFVQYNSGIEGTATIMVTDISGRQVYVQKQQTIVGMQQHEIATNQFSPGLYLVHIIQDNKRVTSKFAVTR